MKSQYSSFLVRCWRETSGGRRILVEHVQSGERVALPNLEAALGWLATRTLSPPGESGANDARGPTPQGERGEASGGGELGTPRGR